MQVRVDMLGQQTEPFADEGPEVVVVHLAVDGHAELVEDELGHRLQQLLRRAEEQRRISRGATEAFDLPVESWPATGD